MNVDMRFSNGQPAKLNDTTHVTELINNVDVQVLEEIPASHISTQVEYLEHSNTNLTDENGSCRVIRYFNLYQSGTYILTTDKPLDADYVIPISYNQKDGYLLQCYSIGHINKVTVSYLLSRKIDKAYKNGLNPNAVLTHLEVIDSDKIIGIYFKEKGIKKFKAHLSANITDREQLHLQGYKVIYNDFDEIEYKILPLELKAELNRLIYQSFSATGKPVNNSYYEKEWSILKSLNRAKIDKSHEYNILFNNAFYLLNSRRSSGGDNIDVCSLLDQNEFALKNTSFDYMAASDEDYRQAIKLFSEAILINPKSKFTYNFRGIAKYRLNDNIGSINDCNQALKIDPNYAHAFRIRGNAKSAMNDFGGAISDFSKAIELEESPVISLFNRANTYKAIKDYAKAVADCDRIIELDPNFSLAHSLRGKIKVILKDHKGGIEDISKGIMLDPDDNTAYGLRGNAKAEMRDFKGAIEDFTSLIDRVDEKDSDAIVALKRRGHAKVNISDFKGAIIDYDKVIKLKPDDGAAYLARGKAKIEIYDFDGADDDIAMAKKLNSN